MERIDWELMRPQDIEVRPAVVKDNKATLLLFQNSRTAMDALDRKFGEFGWQIEYRAVGEQIYGCLSIKDPETGEWISKMDTGEESNISAQKGMSSDILKRCAVRFGYGRELYTAPRIIVEDDGYGCSGYKVSYIDYNENREIVRLKIVNRFGKVVFDWTEDIKTPYKPQNEVVGLNIDHNATAERINALTAFCAEKKGTVANNILKCFYDYYKAKADTWEGNMDFPRLWDGWLKRQNGSFS